jgi:hypothetical protein
MSAPHAHWCAMPCPGRGARFVVTWWCLFDLSGCSTSVGISSVADFRRPCWLDAQPCTWLGVSCGATAASHASSWVACKVPFFLCGCAVHDSDDSSTVRAFDASNNRLMGTLPMTVETNFT